MEPINAVFLSYASEDAEAAQRICEALRSGGIEVWFDKSELRGGDAWDASIRQQIKKCALLVPMISRNTQSRPEGYFRLEWKLAVDRSHLMASEKAFLLPVVIDQTGDADALVPDRFREVQWTHLPDGHTPAVFVERVQRLLSQSVQAKPAAVATQQAAKRAKRPMLALAAVAVVLVGGIVYWLAHQLAGAPPVSGTAPAIPEKSIAVLPFVDMSEKKDQEYFSDGLSEELIDHLTHAPDLKVIARTSSFQFKGKNEDMRSIAAKLGVANLLEGSVRRSGSSLRITAQLIRGTDGTHLWSQSYDRPINDIFKIQDEIAGTVAEALNVVLSGTGGSTDRHSANIDAYNLYLKANYFRSRNNKGDNGRAIELFTQAINLDPEYALAWAHLASAYISQGGYNEIAAIDATSKARAAVRHALAIDPNLSVAHNVLGTIYEVFDWDWAAARAEYEKALSLDQNGPHGLAAKDALASLSAFRNGDFANVIRRDIEEAERNPLDIGSIAGLAYDEFFAGNFDKSADTFRKVLDLNPTYQQAHGMYGQNLLFMGRYAEGLASIELESHEQNKLESLVFAYWELGRKEESDAALMQLKKLRPDPVLSVAKAHARRGEFDAAFESLETAYKQRIPAMAYIKYDANLRNLRGDPRFHALMKKMQLEE